MSAIRRHVVPLALVVAFLGGGAAVAVFAGAPEPQREIVLVAQGMAFYLPGDPSPNPTLVVRAGERFRLTLRNADPGIAHDLVVSTLGIEIAPLVRGRAVASVALGAPREPGRHGYLCSLHPQMMRGELVVVP